MIKLAVPLRNSHNIYKMNETMNETVNGSETGIRYVVELGGVSYDERGYLRYDFTKLLGEEIKHRFKWSNLRNATQFYTEGRAREMAMESDLDGFKVVIKTRAFDEYCNTQCKGPWLWENKGSV
jgi:hypothetical protein